MDRWGGEILDSPFYETFEVPSAFMFAAAERTGLCLKPTIWVVCVLLKHWKNSLTLNGHFFNVHIHCITLRECPISVVCQCQSGYLFTFKPSEVEK